MVALMRSALALLAVVFAAPVSAADISSDTLVLAASSGHLPDVPISVRVEVHNADGAVDRSLCDAEALLVADPPTITLSPSRIPLRNGIGGELVSVTLAGHTGPWTVKATLGALSAERTVRDLAAEPIQPIAGALPAAVTEWSGVVHVTADLSIAAGEILRILPGTLVLVAGVLTGEDQPGECGSSTPGKCGTVITVNGTLESLGTEAEPVTITAREPAKAWGEIHHSKAAVSTYSHTFITRAGNSRRGGHTNTGPAIRTTDSKVIFDWVTLSDTAGKSMACAGSDLTFHNSLLARSIMGPEVGSTAILCEDTAFQEMRGSDDNDGIYLHGQRAGQLITLRRVTVAGGDDDGIDTLGSEVLLEDVIVRDFDNPDEDSKGVSILNGEADLRRCLVVDCKDGISAKTDADAGRAVTRIDRCTVARCASGVFASDKNNKPDAKILFFVSNSILEATQAVKTDYPPGDIDIRYSNLSQPWTGEGNAVADPRFVDAAAGDFHLQLASPCVDTGDPLAANDPDGTRADQGVYPLFQGTPVPRFRRGFVNDDGEIDLSDAVRVLFHLFAGESILCADAADLDDDGAVAVTDAVRILEFLFRAGPAPSDPFAACGLDATEDALGCDGACSA